MTSPPIPPTPPTAAKPGQAPEEDPAAGASGSAASVAPPEGTTSINEKMHFEVEVLSHVAASKLAVVIAERVARAIKTTTETKEKIPGEEGKALEGQTRAPGVTAAAPGKATTHGVILLDETLGQALAFGRAFQLQKDLLIEAFRKAEKIAQTADSELKEAKLPEDGEAASFSAAAAIAGIGSVVNILAFFRVDTEYFGRTASVSQQALVMEVARALREKANGAVRFLWPSLGAFPRLVGADSRPSYLGDISEIGSAADNAAVAIHNLAVKVQELPDNDENLPAIRAFLDHAHEIHESSREIFDGLRESLLQPGGEGKFSPAQLLQLASDVGRLLSADNGGGSPGKAEWFFLTVRVEAAGGSYRTRRHLWQALTGEPQAAASGGAIVSFALLKRDGDFAESGTLVEREPFHDISKELPGMARAARR